MYMVTYIGNSSLQYSYTLCRSEVNGMFFLCVCTYIPDNEWLPYVMYRLRDNKFTESGKTRLRQAGEEREKLTGFKKIYLRT